MGYNIGPKIGIDGEKEFRKQIRQIDQEYKMLQAETRAVTAAFEANGDEQGKLEAASKQLQKQIDVQKDKISQLKDALYKATVKYGENSVEANRLRGALYDTEAAVTGLENELSGVRTKLRGTGESMEELADAADDAEQATLDFGDVLAANLVSDLALDALRTAADLIKDFAVGSIEVAASVKAADAQFEQTFGDLEETARASLESISDDTKIASTRMQESFTRIFAFAQTVGTESDEAMNIASRAMLAAADSAAYYDRSIEDATETLQSFLKGNFENDAALGIAATETTRNTKANELYAKSFKELSESQKVDVLLSMVEAGNAASGALGQAARESDAWENVTGELTESMRQLQAQAGKAALKKITPIIQKITKACYELIDEVDWDEFGDTVADVIDTAVDEGPKVLKVVTSLAAGIVAFKATQKAGQMVQLATGFLQIGQAAQTAGTAVATSGAMAAVSPWGLAAVAIGAVVALVTSLAIESVTSADEVDKLSAAIDDFKTRADDAISNYEDTTTSIEGTAYAAERYVQRLQELEAAGLDSTAANEEYAMTVEKLNELIPELNLTIDEQTGLVAENTDKIKADIEAWKERAAHQALHDKFSEILEAQGEATAELALAEARLKDAQEDRVRLEKRHTSLSEALTRTTEELTEAQEDLARATDPEEVEVLSQRIQELNLRQDEYYDGCLRLEAELEEMAADEATLSGQISASKDVVASYSDEIRLAESAIDMYQQKVSTASATEEGMRYAVERVQAQVDTLAESYLKASTKARESLDSQIGIFDELEKKSDVSVPKIIKNWDEQRKAFDEYAENLKKAVDMGLDEDLVRQLSDGSVESMAILDEMVNNTETNVEDINTAFTKMDESRTNVAQTMTDIQTDLDDTLLAMAEDAQEGGIDIVDGLIKGVDLRIPRFETVMRRLALSGQRASADADDRHSPSRIYEQGGIDDVDGLIIGVDGMIAKFEEKMAQAGAAGQRAYLDARLEHAQSYPSMYGASTSGGNKTVHMGGISIQIYPQGGQDADDIADAVMTRFQIELERKAAGL